MPLSELTQQDRQVLSDSIPDPILIDQDVAMRDPVAYPAHFPKSDFWARNRKFRMSLKYLLGRFTDDLQAHCDGMLCPPVLKKIAPAQSLDKADRVSCRGAHLIQII